MLVPASFTDPRLEHLIEETGMIIASTEIDCFWPEGQRTSPKLQGTPDVYEGVCSYRGKEPTIYRSCAVRRSLVQSVIREWLAVPDEWGQTVSRGVYLAGAICVGSGVR